MNATAKGTFICNKLTGERNKNNASILGIISLAFNKIESSNNSLLYTLQGKK